MSDLNHLAKSYVAMFGLIHGAAFLLNVRVEGYPGWGEASLIVLSGLCFFALNTNWKPLYAALAMVWSLLAMAQWVHLAPWLPVWSDLQYTTFAVLDMVLVVAFIYLAGEKP